MLSWLRETRRYSLLRKSLGDPLDAVVDPFVAGGGGGGDETAPSSAGGGGAVVDSDIVVCMAQV